MIVGRWTRILLVVLETLMGLAAVVSGPALIATDGLGMPAEWMANSPFRNYAVPGLVLLAVGLVNLAGAFLVLSRNRWAVPASAVAGLLWVGWFVVQVVVVGLVSWQQPFYFVVGLVILGLSTPALINRFGTRTPPGRKGAIR